MTKYVPTKYCFNENNIDPTILNPLVEQTSISIYQSKAANQYRNLHQIKEAVITGLTAEAFMIQYHNCKNNPHKYGDILTTNNIPVECKVSTRPWTDRRKNNMLNKIKAYTPSQYIMFWYKYNNEYRYQGAIPISQKDY